MDRPGDIHTFAQAVSAEPLQPWQLRLLEVMERMNRSGKPIVIERPRCVGRKQRLIEVLRRGNINQG
jgi:hypothetical protein